MNLEQAMAKADEYFHPIKNKMNHPFHRKPDLPKERLYDVGYLLAIIEWLRQQGYFDEYCEEQLRAGRNAANDDLAVRNLPHCRGVEYTRLREWDIDPVYHDWLRSFGLRILNREAHIHSSRHI
jgi:hypothetical protein